MYAFNSAAIFLPGHPYIESTTVLSDMPVHEKNYIMLSLHAHNSTASYYATFSLRLAPLMPCITLVSYDLDDSDDIVRCARDLVRKANHAVYFFLC